MSNSIFRLVFYNALLFQFEWELFISVNVVNNETFVIVTFSKLMDWASDFKRVYVIKLANPHMLLVTFID